MYVLFIQKYSKMFQKQTNTHIHTLNQLKDLEILQNENKSLVEKFKEIKKEKENGKSHAKNKVK